MFREKVIDDQGNEVYLLDYCLGDKNLYDKIRQNMKNGYSLWEAKYNCKPILNYREYFEIEVDKCVREVYSSLSAFLDDVNLTRPRYTTAINSGCKTKSEIINFIYVQEVPKYQVGHHYETYQNLLKIYGMSDAAVQSRRAKGMSLEEALTKPLERLRYIKVNGEVNTVKYWSEYFGLKPKAVIKYRGINKTSIKDTYIALGVNLDGYEIEE